VNTAIALFLPLFLGIAIVLLAACILTGSPARRLLGVLVACTLTLPPWLTPPEHSTVRGLWAVIAAMGVVRSIDLLRGEWTLRDRLVHVVSVVDTRKLSPSTASPGTIAWLLLRCVAWEALALGCYLVWCRVPAGSGVGWWLTRWSFALFFAYTLTEGAYFVLSAGYHLAGFATPPLHIVPAASRSVQEFWGARWNRTVSSWLGETCFRPLARRRKPLLGAVAAFSASGVLHAYIAWVAVGGAMAVLSFFYFFAQSVLMLVEVPLRVRKWQPVAGHVWAVFWMVLLSPGFTEPMARTLGL